MALSAFIRAAGIDLLNVFLVLPAFSPYLFLVSDVGLAFTSSSSCKPLALACSYFCWPRVRAFLSPLGFSLERFIIFDSLVALAFLLCFPALSLPRFAILAGLLTLAFFLLFSALSLERVASWFLPVFSL